MKLKRTLTLDEHNKLDAALQQYYVASKDKDGNPIYTLDTEDPPAPDPDDTSESALQATVANLRKQVDEFRNNNTALAKERDDAVARSRARPEDATFAEQIQELKADLDKERDLRQRHEQALQRRDFHAKLAQAAKKHGLNPNAASDIAARAEAAGFRADQKGNVAAFDSDGNVIEDSPGNVLTLNKWLSRQKQSEAPHLFGQPSGTGSDKHPGTAGHKGQVVRNPTDAFLEEHLEKIASGEIVIVTEEDD